VIDRDERPLIQTLDEAAAGTHEMFSAYLRAGFTEEQAMRLLMQQLRLAHECPGHSEHGET